MGKGSGWNILRRGTAEPAQPSAPAPVGEHAPAIKTVAVPPPPPPVVNRADRVATALATLPRYFTIKDLVEAFSSKDSLLDAYVQGHLTPLAEQTLESNYLQLHCWLLARVIRLELGSR